MKLAALMLLLARVASAQLGPAMSVLLGRPDPAPVMNAWFRADQTLYQDVAGTIPATTNTAPVCKWPDVSSNSLSVTQTPGSSNPTLAIGSDGVRGVKFDGTNNYLQAASAANWLWLSGPTTGATVIVACSSDEVTPTATEFILTTGANSGNVKGYRLSCGTSASVGAWISNGTNFLNQTGLNRTFVPGINIFETRWTPGYPNTGYLEQWTCASTNFMPTTNADATASANPTSPLTLGRRSNAGAFFFKGKIYEAQLWQGQLTDAFLTARCAEIADRVNTDIVRWIDNGGTYYSAFPHIAKLGDGTLVAVYSLGTNHTGALATYLSRSSDSGRTWSPPTVCATNSTYQTGDAYLTSLGGNNLAMVYNQQLYNTNIANGIRVVTSSTGGLSWSAPVTVSDGFALWSLVTGPIVTNGAGWYLPLYGADATNGYQSCRMIQSGDGGLTWTNSQVIANGTNDLRNYTEPNLIVTSGTTNFTVLIRDVTLSKIDAVTTTNAGVNWSAVTTNLFGGRGAPHVVKLESGNYICVTRGDSSGLHEQVRWSTNCVNWNTTEIPFDGSGLLYSNFLYGAPVEVSAGVIGICWSQEISSTRADVRFRRLKEADVIAYP